MSRLHFGFGRRAARRRSPAATASRALIVEREVEEFVERVVGLGPEPRQELRAAASAPSSARKKRERRHLRAACAELSSARRGGELGSLVALRAQARAQRALAVPGELEQLLVVRAEQRALQHGREREIVVRQQQRVGQRHQVHHRDVLGQHQPVGAGDRDARRSSARG